MRKQNILDLEKYLDDEVACAYETRIPEGFSSREMAFLPIIFGLMYGVGIFMAHDAAMGKVAFWSNPVVLFGVALALYCNLIGLWMFFSRWNWTAIQPGLLMIGCLPAVYYSFSGAGLADIVLYGTATLEIKLIAFTLSLAWNGYWVYVTVRGCQAIWADESLRQRVWVSYRDAVVYRRSGAKAAMDQVGIKIHPNNLTVILGILLILPLAWWRIEVSALFGVPIIHVIGVVGQSILVMGWIGTVLPFMLMLYYPLKIQRTTGKPVLFDMMAPATAPIPSQNS